MSDNIDPLGHYLNYVADIIDVRAKLAQSGAHKGDIGTNREIVCREFLDKHVPPRLGVYLGGEIFGTQPNVISKQIDIVVTHDTALKFFENNKPQFPVESVAAAITVKSTLDKGKLFEALENLASIPLIDMNVMKFLQANTINTSEFFNHYPARYIFAFDGSEIDTCIANVELFLKEKKPLPNCLPNGIIVNRKYLITLTVSHEEKGNKVKFAKTDCTGNMRGQPILWLTADIAKVISWLGYMQLNYQGYIDKAFSEVDNTM